MAKSRKCSNIKCQKQITEKYFLITGLGGYEGSRKNFCPTCCEHKKKESKIIKNYLCHQ